MKKLFKSIATLLASVLVLGSLGAFAETADTAVLGDVNADSVLDIIDVSMTRADIIGTLEFTDAQKQQGDMNSDDVIDVIDVSLMRKTIIDKGGIDKLSMGTVEGLDYTNKFFGLGAKFGDGWTYLTESELADINYATNDEINSDPDKYLADHESFTDMTVMKNEANMLAVVVTKPEAGYTEETLDSEIDAFIALMKEFASSAEGVQITAEKVTVDLAGEACRGAKIDASDETGTDYMRMVFIPKGDYFAGIMVVTDDAAFAENYTDYFYSVK